MTRAEPVVAILDDVTSVPAALPVGSSPAVLQDPERGYRRLGWQRTRRSVREAVGLVAGLAPGAAVGLWLTQAWTSVYLAGTVIVLAAALPQFLRGQLVRRLRRRPADLPAPQLVRCILDGRDAVVALPSRPTGMVASLVATALGMVTFPVVAGNAGPAVAPLASVVVGILAMAFLSPLSWLPGPALALFADRVEIRKEWGRYVVPRSDILGARELHGRVVIDLTSKRAVQRRGWVRRPSGYGVPLGDLEPPPRVVIDAIDRLAHQSA